MSSTSINLQQFGSLLDQKLQPLQKHLDSLGDRIEVVHGNMMDLKSNVDNQIESLTDDFNEEVSQMKAQLSQVTHDLEQCKLKLNSSDAFQSGQDPSDTARMIAALQDEVRKLKLAGVESCVTSLL